MYPGAVSNLHWVWRMGGIAIFAARGGQKTLTLGQVLRRRAKPCVFSLLLP